MFDPATTPSKGMGGFSEFVRTLPGARRSPHPMQSVAAIGPLADVICKTDTASSFDPGGPFSILLECGARGLLLGAPMQSFSLVHLAEERLAGSLPILENIQRALRIIISNKKLSYVRARSGS